MAYFDHDKLDAYRVSVEALVVIDGIARALPKGYAKLKDQMQRASQSAVLLTSEASARSGADRSMRFRWARAEAGEAGAALECATRLRLTNAERATEARELLLRLSAMLHQLAGP